ncbi:hypothetical protein [Streptococcus suis]
MRNLIEKFKTFLLAGYGSHVLLGFILGWALLKLNGFVLLLILQFSSYWVKLFFLGKTVLSINVSDAFDCDSANSCYETSETN